MPIRVLHVDDDPGLVATTAEFLERTDDRFEVATATSPTDALRELDPSAVDCVVSDFQMPEMDGLELLAAVRDVAPRMPFILFTGRGSEEIAAKAVSVGVTDYLQKSTGTDQYTVLTNRVRNAVAKARAEADLRRTSGAIEALHESTRDLMAAESREEIAEVTAAAAENTLGYPFTVVRLRDDEGLLVPVAVTDRDTFGTRPSYAPGEGAAGEAYARGEADLYDDVSRRPADGDYVDAAESAMYLPVGDHGVVSVIETDPGAFDRSDLDLAATLVANAEAALDRIERERRVETLHESTRDLMAAGSREEVAKTTAAAAKNTLGYPSNVVRLRDDEGLLAPVAVTDEMQSRMGGERPAYEAGEGTAGHAFAVGEPVVYEDVTDIDDDVDRGNVRASMYVPVGDHGVVTISDTEAGALDGSDIDLAEILAANAAAALDTLVRERR